MSAARTHGRRPGEISGETLKEMDRRWWENLDHYCVRCDSCVGYDPKRPEFCVVCWYTRLALPRRVRERILKDVA